MKEALAKLEEERQRLRLEIAARQDELRGFERAIELVKAALQEGEKTVTPPVVVDRAREEQERRKRAKDALAPTALPPVQWPLRPPAPAEKPPKPKMRTTPVVLDLGGLLSKAAEWGIIHEPGAQIESTLAAMNEKALRVGHPQFILER